MAYSELANWDGSLSTRNPTLLPKTKASQLYQSPASGSNLRTQATNYASGLAKADRSSSHSDSTRGESSQRAGDVGAELRKTATRLTTVNTVAHGFANDQTLLDSGCVPFQGSTQPDNTEDDQSNISTLQAMNGVMVSRTHTEFVTPPSTPDQMSKLPDRPSEPDLPKPNVSVTVASESIQNPPIIAISNSISSSSIKKDRSEKAIASSQSSNSASHEIVASSHIPQSSESVPQNEAFQTIRESPKITRRSAISRIKRHSLPSTSTPSLQREEATPSRRKQKYDGVYVPPLAITRDLYKPLSSYFPLAHPVPSKIRSSSPMSSAVLPMASTTPNITPEKAPETMADVRGETAEVAENLELATGMSASTPIVVGHSLDQIPQAGMPSISTHENGDSTKSQLSPATRKPDLSPITDMLKRHAEISESTIVADNSKWVTSNAPRHPAKSEEGESIHVLSQWNNPALSTNNSKPKATSTHTFGKKRSKDDDDDDFEYVTGDIDEDDLEETCHQCRQRNIFAKMKCCRIKDDDVCPSSYCHRCIALRYPIIDFNPDAVNFVCPKCSDLCNCEVCCSAQGRTYVPTKNSRKRLEGVPLLLSHTETRRLEELKKIKQGPKNGNNKLTGGKNRKPRISRAKAKPCIGEDAEIWLRTRGDKKSGGRSLRRSFVGEWSKAWGAQPVRIREMECALPETCSPSQPTPAADKSEGSKCAQRFYVGEPVHQLLRRFKERDKTSTDNAAHHVVIPPQAEAPPSQGRREGTIEVERPVPKPKRQKIEPHRSTSNMPEFTINHRESEASSSSSSSVMRLVTPADSIFNYNAYLEDGHDDPMLGSVNQNDSLDGLNLDLNNPSLDGIHSDPFSFTYSYNTFDRQTFSGSRAKTYEGQTHPIGINTDDATLLGGTISGLEYSTQSPSDAFIYGMPSYSGLTKEELERVARLALASFTNSVI